MRLRLQLDNTTTLRSDQGAGAIKSCPILQMTGL